MMIDQEHKLSVNENMLKQAQDQCHYYQDRCDKLELRVEQLESEAHEHSLAMRQAKQSEALWKQRYEEMLEVSKERVDQIVGRQRDDLEEKYNKKVELICEENKLVKDELLRLQKEFELKIENECTQQMLNDQLKEMTEVLEEFDAKYTKKEKALQVAKQQNDQLKKAYENMR